MYSFASKSCAPPFPPPRLRRTRITSIARVSAMTKVGLATNCPPASHFYDWLTEYCKSLSSSTCSPSLLCGCQPFSVLACNKKSWRDTHTLTINFLFCGGDVTAAGVWKYQLMDNRTALAGQDGAGWWTMAAVALNELLVVEMKLAAAISRCNSGGGVNFLLPPTPFL